MSTKSKRTSSRSTRRRPDPRLGLEERRLQRVAHAVENPVLFGELYVRPYSDGWDQDLPRKAGAMLLFADAVRRGVVVTPPEWLKTTVLSQLRPLWLTCRWAALGRLAALAGMLMSEEQRLAERNLAVVSWHIEFNERIRRDFVDDLGRPLVEPDPDEEKWTDSELIVRRAGKSKDPTWQAKGIEAKGIQGARLTHLLGDDVVTPASAESAAKQRTALRLWDQQVTTRLIESGQAVVAGNFNGDRDLLATLAKRRTYRVFRRPSLHVPGHPEQAPDDPADPKAVVALPEKWSRKRLQLEREEKPNSFRRIHLLDSTAEAGERLKVAWMTLIDPSATPVAGTRWVMGLDPASGGESDDLDYFNVTVLGLHADNVHADIAICHDVRASAAAQGDLVAAYHDRFSRVGAGVLGIGIAKVALDNYFGGIMQILRPDIARKLTPVTVSKATKEERLEALGPFAKSGWLRCWDTAWDQLTSAENDQPQELTLFEQWRDFTPTGLRHDDKLDGLDVAQRAATELGYKGRVRTVKLKPAGRRG